MIEPRVLADWIFECHFLISSYRCNHYIRWQIGCLSRRRNRLYPRPVLPPTRWRRLIRIWSFKTLKCYNALVKLCLQLKNKPLESKFLFSQARHALSEKGIFGFWSVIGKLLKHWLANFQSLWKTWNGCESIVAVVQVPWTSFGLVSHSWYLTKRQGIPVYVGRPNLTQSNRT